MSKVRYWSCPRGCGTRNPRTLTKCSTPGCTGRKPKARVPRHARTLRDDPYATYAAVNATIHGVSDEACGACEKPRGETRRHDRDHDHRTGKPRGLLCARHNQMLDSRTTAEELRALADYLERVERFYAAQRDAA